MKYKSEIYEVVHQDAVANFKIGAITKDEMCKFDEMCLAQEIDTKHVSESPTIFEYAAV